MEEQLMASKRKRNLSIALPASLVSEHRHLRDKTRTLGTIARAASIYRVETVYIYGDKPDESHLVRIILEYIDTPQYLRKRLYRKKEELSFAGILPPLRAPHHPLEHRPKYIPLGSFREGVMLFQSDGENLVDIGMQQPIATTGRTPSRGSRVTVQVNSIRPLKGRIVKAKDVGLYWGYKVHLVKRLSEVVDREDFDLTIGTSRKGEKYLDVHERLRGSWVSSRNILMVYGSPHKGIEDIMKAQGQNVQLDYNVNMIPGQGSATVRTEEALHASLAILNILDSGLD
jgi:predicted SPOUT superfamily RNA methylase MTH1